MKSPCLSLDEINLKATMVLLYILGVGLLDKVLRIILQGVFFFSFPLYYSNVLIYSLFFGIVLIILKAIDPHEKTSKTIRYISNYFWIIAFNPVIQYMINGKVYPSLFSSELLSILFLAVILSVLLVINIVSKAGVVKSVLATFGIILVSIPVFLINRVSLIGGLQPSFKLYEIFTLDVFLKPGWSEALLTYQQYHLIVVFLLIENIIVYAYFTKLFHRDMFSSIIQSIRPFRTLHFVMMVILGSIFVSSIAPLEALSLSSINHIPFIVIPAFCLLLLWQFTTLLNDMYDLEIDIYAHPDRPLVSGNIGTALYKDLLLSIVILSSLLSLLLGIPLLLLNFGALLLGIIYSVPPFRLRDRIYGHICVGLGSLIGFIFGVYSPEFWRHGLYISSRVLERNIPFFPDVFFVSILIVVVLSISPLINALSDFEGDSKSGVKNVYTVLGFEKGKRLVSALIVILFMSPLLLFNSVWDFIVMFSAGVISSFVFFRFEDHRPVFGLYFLILLYVMFRFFGYI